MFIGNFYAFAPFLRQFGTPEADGTLNISSAWQTGLSNGANVGEIIGLQFAGYMSEKYGYR